MFLEPRGQGGDENQGAWEYGVTFLCKRPVISSPCCRHCRAVGIGGCAAPGALWTSGNVRSPCSDGQGGNQGNAKDGVQNISRGLFF